ncbi:endolytic transglycosylase MltG [Methylolobus aquaticus]|nr:endolytic transglycosylase MltG [Methylolobus aquaticus]
MSRWRWAGVAILLVGLLFLAAEFLGAVRAVSATSSETIFEIRKGESVRGVARRLRAEGISEWPKWLVFQAYWKGVARNLKYGEYVIPPHVSIEQLLALLASGKTRRHSITFVEGWTFDQILNAVQAHPALEHALAGRGRDELLAAIGLAGEHPEGRFFPDTYLFAKGYRDTELLRRANEKMASVLETEWRQRQDGLPYATPTEALTLASIVEKETSIDAERPRVAGVFVRRLRRGMRLQADPTVIYGMGAAYRGDITRQALLSDTPYNTYTRAGLPPTPIAMPGLASLQAALHPDAGDSLYFVAAGNGSHVFSSTLAEHQRAVAAFLKKQRHDE